MTTQGKAATLLLLCLTLPVPLYAAPTADASVSGIKIGMSVDKAHALLTAQGASSGVKGSDDKKEGDAKKDKAGDPDNARPEVWTLKGTAYEKIVFAADDDDRVLWVTGFARPGQSIPFAHLGNLAKAAASAPTFAVWNILSPGGSCREIARGRGGEAVTVSLLPLKSADPNGIFSPQIIPKNALKTSPKAGTDKQIGTEK